MMSRTCIILLLHLSVSIFPAHACKYVKIESSVLGQAYNFYQDAYDAKYHKAGTRRPKYTTKTNSTTEYTLQHRLYDDLSGTGVWEILQVNEIVARVESWAITPYLVDAIADNDSPTAIWRVKDIVSGTLTPDPSVLVQCIEAAADDVLFFIPPAVSDNQADIHGFYIKQILPPPPNTSLHEPVYAKVSVFIADKPLFLFRFQFSPSSSNWMIGEEYGKDDGIAYLSSTSVTVNSSLKGTWHYLQNGEWTPDHTTTKILSTPYPVINETIYDLLRSHRTLNSLPTIGQSVFKLRSGQLIPSVGLGTGGISHRDCYTVFYDAIDLGYRMFDLAREYNNEQYMGEVLRDLQSTQGTNGATTVQRSDLYLISKVWPTNLGFEPTLREITASLGTMEVNYLDMFLLHWPACDDSIDWMHCDTVVDPTATWHESWRAMEKALAEGLLSSIGVSNFDLSLLQELRDMAVIQPELVQNYGALGHLDLPVRQFCHKYGIAYQPYATIRNLKGIAWLAEEKLPRKHAMQIANKRNISEHRVSLQFFLQTNAVIIPRAVQYHHLEENIAMAYEERELLSEEEMAELGWVKLEEDDSDYEDRSRNSRDEEL